MTSRGHYLRAVEQVNIICHHCGAPLAAHEVGAVYCDGCVEFFAQLTADAELDRAELAEMAAEAGLEYGL